MCAVGIVPTPTGGSVDWQASRKCGVASVVLSALPRRDGNAPGHCAWSGPTHLAGSPPDDSSELLSQLMFVNDSVKCLKALQLGWFGRQSDSATEFVR
jgi:hypothetical protein